MSGQLDWTERAACKNLTYLFFSSQEDEDNPKKETGRRERIRRAKAICDTCPVFTDCEDWYKSGQGTPQGIGAGKTPSERRKAGWPATVIPLTF